MIRAVLLFLFVLLTASSATASDLPPGALVRLGDDRFRAGSAIEHLAISPDGKQFATVRNSYRATFILTVWDATTGLPIREREINDELFKGLVWGPTGGFAVVLRGEPAQGDKRAKVFPDDFRVWEFTDPKAKVPPVLPAGRVGLSGFSGVEAEWPRDGAKYTDFQFSAGGKRAAGLWSSAVRYAVHVFELKPTDTAKKLKRVDNIDLGAVGADDFRISSDGKTLVTFRKLANPDAAEYTATTWDVETGKPSRPVRVPRGERLIVTPDARSLVVFVAEDETWGFDLYDLETGKRRQLTRWKYERGDGQPTDWGGFAFTPSGRELVVAIDGKTFVIDLIAGKELGRLEGHADTPTAVAVSADGTRIATADEYGLVRLWDAKTPRPLNEALGHRAPVEYAQLSPNGKLLLTWGYDRTVRLWDLATGKELRAFTGARYDEPTFTPDGTTILYSTYDRYNPGRLIARDILTGLEVPLPGDMAKLEPRTAVFAPDGKSVLTWAEHSANDKPCEVWEWSSGKKLASWNSDAGNFAPGFSPDGSVIFTYPTSPERRDAKTGKELPPAWKDARDYIHKLRSLRPNPCWCQFAPNEDELRIVEAGTDKLVSRVRFMHAQGGSPAYHGIIAISSTGGQFASEWSNGIYLCESATGQVRRTLRGHRGAIRVLGFTPDGSKLLTAGGDHTILVWDVRLQAMPLTEAVKKETSAAKLWATLAAGKAEDAYLAMARLATEPDTALKMARMKLKPATKDEKETDATLVTDSRAIELLEALNTEDSRELLKELAAGEPSAFRTQQAKLALERLGKARYKPSEK
ncbi:MAG: hypothetical protein L0241_16450 [Planctomycetia bacterium]|nr:hypothetical protein [Planctomycetia bacterium]